MSDQLYSDFGIDQKFNDWLATNARHGKEYANRHPVEKANGALAHWWVSLVISKFLEDAV